MHIDPSTTFIFNIIGSLSMSAALFLISHGYLGEVQGIRHWAVALLLQAVGWTLLILTSVFPVLVKIAAGSLFTMLSLACYFHAVVKFKGFKTPVRWAYGLAISTFIIQYIAFYITHELAIRMIILGISGAILLFATSVLLLKKSPENTPISHQFTGYTFVFCAAVMATRVIYYGVLHNHSVKGILEVNIMQDLSYMAFYITVVVTSFGFLLMCNDKYVYDRKQTEEKLRESEAHLRIIIESEPECIKIVDAEGRLTQMNPAGLAMIQADSFEQVKNCVVLDIVAPEHRLAFSDMHNRVIAGESVQLEFEIIDLKGERHWMETHAVPLLECGKRVQLAITRDITERKTAEEEIKRLAFFDPLTGLPNRRRLLDRLQYAVTLNHRANSQFAVFMIDLDKFKVVNDSLGHAAGDELLKQVALRITACLRDSDMVARLGGDEFVLVLENLKVQEDAEIIALKVIADLTIPFQLNENNSVQIGTSIGISLYPQHGTTPEKLIDHADTALYQAKDNGRGCFAHFSAAISTEAV